MTRRVWPFRPLTPINEALEWSTDVFRAKAGEQRMALRSEPLRMFQYEYVFRNAFQAHAQSLIRSAQGEGGFWVPDWSQAAVVGAVTAGSGVVISVDLDYVQYGDYALLWESDTSYEAIAVTAGVDTLTADVVNSFTNAKIMPLWRGDTGEGLSSARSVGNLGGATIGFTLTESYDIGASAYPSYRSHDVMTDRPIVGASNFAEQLAYPVSMFGGGPSDFKYIRQRELEDYTFQMRWRELTPATLYALRQWLHSRRGRQKAFWISSWAKDLEASSISGTTVTVFNDIIARPSGYDIEIVSGGTSYYRQVTNVVAGADVGGRPTVDLTIDSSVPVGSADRISYLTCARLDSDRVEMNHIAGEGSLITVPCREIPVP